MNSSVLRSDLLGSYDKGAYSEMVDVSRRGIESDSRRIWSKPNNLTEALLTARDGVPADLSEAYKRHSNLHLILQWIGVSDCSPRYSLFICGILFANFLNKVILVDREEGVYDEGTGQFLFYTTRVAHLVYEIFGIVVYFSLKSMLSDAHWEDGGKSAMVSQGTFEVKKLGGFKQLLRADADIFKMPVDATHTDEDNEQTEVVLISRQRATSRYQDLMWKLQFRVILFFVVNTGLGASWTIYTLVYDKFSVGYSIFTETLYFMSRMTRQAAMTTASYIMVVLLRSHIQAIRELILFLQTAKWEFDEQEQVGKNDMDRRFGTVTTLSHSTLQSITLSDTETLSQLLDRHIQLKRRCYDMIKITGTVFGIFNFSTLAYFIISIFQLAIAIQVAYKTDHSSVIFGVCISQAQSLMLIDLTIFWLLPTATLLTREARKIESVAAQAFVRVQVMKGCSQEMHLQLQAVLRYFQLNAPIYKYNGGAVDNEFIQRSIAVLFGVFFFTLNIWISDVVK